MIAKYLWISGSLILFIMGSLHLVYTFFTNKFSTKNEKLIADMKVSYPILTKEMNMWNAWVGFNASHSSGVIFIGVINLYLALQYFSILQSDHFFFLFNILTIGFYFCVGIKFWFKIPLTGVTIILICYIVSYILTL